MVGGKLDLQEKRSVETEDAVEIQEKYNLASYIEISAITGENVKKMFDVIINLMLKRTEGGDYFRSKTEKLGNFDEEIAYMSDEEIAEVVKERLRERERLAREPEEKFKKYKKNIANVKYGRETYGLLSIGRKESAVGYLRGNHVEIVRDFTSGVHGKHKAGGQSQKRFERQMEEAETRFYRRISYEVNKLFLGMEDLQGIFIGGPGPSKEKFVNDESLDYRLRDKILDVVDLGYGGIEGIRALIHKIKDQIANVKYIREKQIMQSFLNAVSKDTGLVSYGLKEVQKALNMGAVAKLILSEKLDTYQVNITCSNCKYEESRTAREQEVKKLEMSIQDENCPECGSNTFNVSDSVLIVEELGSIAETMGTEVIIISPDTEEGEMLYSTFGGIVAILRYKLTY
jgi:peptide chain release factor 1